MSLADGRGGAARFPWLLTFLTMVALAGLIALGVWQTQRLVWKQALIARAEAAAALPPAPLDTVPLTAGSEFRRVLVVCPGLPTAPYVELQSIEAGAAGVRLISLCRAPGLDRPVLIDRGFIPDTVSARPPVLPATMPAALLAQLRLTPPPSRFAPAPQHGRFYARDAAAMSRALGAETAAPVTLFALTSSNPQLGALTPGAPPAAFSNNHLGYALTWFGLALGLAGVYAAFLIRRLRA